MIFLYVYIAIAIISLFMFTYLSSWKNDPFDMQQNYSLILGLSLLWPIGWVGSIFIEGTLCKFPYFVLKYFLGEPNANNK